MKSKISSANSASQWEQHVYQQNDFLAEIRVFRNQSAGLNLGMTPDQLVQAPGFCRHSCGNPSKRFLS